MPSSPARAVFTAARSYVARAVPAHLVSYPLAATAAWAASRFAPGLPRPADPDRTGEFLSPHESSQILLALGAAAATFVVFNLVAHRWALASAVTRLARDSGWVSWVVSRLLERATGDDRRGVRSVRRVVGMLGSDAAGSVVARVALGWLGAPAIGEVAEALASIPAGDAPIGERVHARVVALLADRRRTWTAVVAALAGLVAAGASAAAAFGHA